MSFDEVQFPPEISYGFSGGPRRLTEVVTLRSGYEQRNSIWANSRRSYNAGYAIQSLDRLYTVLAFFEARRGRLRGFRFKDWADYKSCPPEQDPSPTDQVIGTGDDVETDFQLKVTYSTTNAYERIITKPVAGTVRVALNGTETTDFTVDTATGIVTLDAAPADGVEVTAGFEFDVPVRFDQDSLDINVDAFQAGVAPDISLIEVK